MNKKKIIILGSIVFVLVYASLGIASAGTYDGKKAADYAYNNAYKGVPGSWYFAYAGGDCTNFASHALAAGGWTMNNFGRTNDLSWYYVAYAPYLSSYTWGASNNLHKYLARSGRAYSSSIYSLEKGDIVQFDIGCDGTWDHTMMVTDKRNGEIYLCYHTEDTRDIAFAKVKEKAEAQARAVGKDVQFSGWHINAQF